MALACGFHADAFELVVSDGIANESIKNKIENAGTAFFNEVNSAFEAGRALNLNNIAPASAQPSIEMLWENVHFRTEDSYAEEAVIQTADGFQIRNIGVNIVGQDATADNPYQEAVLGFDRNGNIRSFYFAIENQQYKNIRDKGVQLDDLELRMMILDYVERFRTSYNQKDLDFLNQVFSDDALIITGSVVKPNAKRNDMLSVSLPTVSYKSQSKKEYLANLARVFKKNRYINVVFNDVKIVRHADRPEFYGVTVRQNYNSSTYSDDGYVFMVWDFTDRSNPQIHVRTWQPAYLDKEKKMPLPEEEIFDIYSIEGI